MRFFGHLDRIPNGNHYLLGWPRYKLPKHFKKTHPGSTSAFFGGTALGGPPKPRGTLFRTLGLHSDRTAGLINLGCLETHEKHGYNSSDRDYNHSYLYAYEATFLGFPQDAWEKFTKFPKGWCKMVINPMVASVKNRQMNKEKLRDQGD